VHFNKVTLSRRKETPTKEKGVKLPQKERTKGVTIQSSSLEGSRTGRDLEISPARVTKSRPLKVQLLPEKERPTEEGGQGAWPQFERGTIRLKKKRWQAKKLCVLKDYLQKGSLPSKEMLRTSDGANRNYE